jgi:hypothetical protein
MDARVTELVAVPAGFMTGTTELPDAAASGKSLIFTSGMGTSRGYW